MARNRILEDHSTSENTEYSSSQQYLEDEKDSLDHSPQQ